MPLRSGPNDRKRLRAMLRKALEIDEKLGHLTGAANHYANLGAVRERAADFVGTREFWTKARDLFKHIGIPNRVQELQAWLDNLPAQET